LSCNCVSSCRVQDVEFASLEIFTDYAPNSGEWRCLLQGGPKMRPLYISRMFSKLRKIITGYDFCTHQGQSILKMCVICAISLILLFQVAPPGESRATW